LISFCFNWKIQFQQWESDGQTELVIIKSTTPKAFCAGGDVKGKDSNELKN
jgi:enoyl-CoA hydratase/carnithine racemase